MQYLLVGLYLVAIVAANQLLAAFGPGASIVLAFCFIGLDLTVRDKLHDLWHGRALPLRMACLIATGSLLSWLLNANAGPIALASFVAFGLAATADALVYSLLHKRSWFARSNFSNFAGAAVDSFVFPTLAFGGFLPEIVLGQFIAKVAGGFIWSLILSGHSGRKGK
jgi:hypothetical protein